MEMKSIENCMNSDVYLGFPFWENLGPSKASTILFDTLFVVLSQNIISHPNKLWVPFNIFLLK